MKKRLMLRDELLGKVAASGRRIISFLLCYIYLYPLVHF
ncbi:hypothetical protein SLEP1_g23747 [Rubroshorea leprosula]|uniref:Uncharacterized protein n=1 Tax=Rubroshorea leprosula TaxID=152421 RepID=A0AAV5JQG6_9ROSI|nr:hypothetical protein SLEP1_g23747 [Rubroshorea leprosula]